jgi:phosphoribosylanthranilate isomerase
MTWIKVCGVTRVGDAIAAAELGVDAVGLIFTPVSSRCVDVETAAQIVGALPHSVLSVGLFMDQTAAEVDAVLRRVPLVTLQFHGSETRQFMTNFGRPVIKALRLGSTQAIDEARSYPASMTVLFDSTDPGSGGRIDTDLLDAVGPDLLGGSYLAGGLDPGNVGQIVSIYRPGGVDVASGLETSPGVKDRARMEDFVTAVREAA